MPKLYNIEVDIHKKFDFGAYRVKVSVLNPDILMYVNGNLVTPPNKENKDWLVKTPRLFKSKGGIVEFDGRSPLWKEYKQACIEAVQEHIRQEEMDAVDSVNDIDRLIEMSPEEYSKELAKQLDEIFPDENHTK